MGQAQVVRRIGAPASAVWKLLSWRGMANLIGDGLFERVEFESSTAEIGTTKRLYIASGLPIRERLEWLDEPGMSYGYRIVDNGSLPITDYVGTLRITPNGADACTVLIQSSFVGVTISDADWKQTWEVMEGGVLEAVAARFEQGAEPAQDDIAATIRARSDVFEADFAAGDAARLVANYYVDTPRVIMPDAPLLEGREAVETMFAGLMKDFSACHLRQIEVRQSGNMAYELSEATVVPRDPKTEPLAVRYIIIWNLVAAQWRVSIDFFGWGHLGLAPSDTS